eukprot:7975438-Pyramimonas_sp.AAC.1
MHELLLEVLRLRKANQSFAHQVGRPRKSLPAAAPQPFPGTTQLTHAPQRAHAAQIALALLGDAAHRHPAPLYVAQELLKHAL